MASKIATILALSSIALAHPRKHHHPFGTGFGTGTGGGFAAPTGRIPFPANGTDGMGAGSPTGTSGSLPVLSVTVQPLPASTGVDAASTGFGDVAASPSGLPVEAASTAPACSLSTSTTTTTTIQYVTVTAGAASSPSGGFGGSVPIVTDLASSSPGVDASSLSLTSTASVAAGQFYGKPSGSFSYGGGGGFGGQSSAAASAIPTTFATMSGSSPSVAWSSSAAALPSASSSSTPTTGGSSSGKKGLSYNTASLLSAFSGDGMTWAYNWAAAAGGTLPSGLEYVPMCWGLSSTSAWGAAAAAAIASGSTHVLSFNEPDLSSQSNIDPATAATNHIKYLNPLSGSAQIGSPAITNGAGTSPLMGIDWLNEFFNSCATNCKVDFVAFHWYATAGDIAYFKQHVQDVIDAAANHGVTKVWLTEFGASGSDSDVASFITEATSFLDSTPAVERYAYFMASDGILLSGSGLSSLGNAYVA